MKQRDVDALFVSLMNDAQLRAEAHQLWVQADFTSRHAQLVGAEGIRRGMAVLPSKRTVHTT